MSKPVDISEVRLSGAEAHSDPERESISAAAQVDEHLRSGVVALQANSYAFAALKATLVVVIWGHRARGK